MSQELESLKAEFERFVGEPVSAKTSTIYRQDLKTGEKIPHRTQLIIDQNDTTFKAAQDLAIELDTQFSFAGQVVAGLGGTEVIAKLEEKDGQHYVSEIEARYC